jgi:cobalt/nickel transport system permease protein
MHRREDLFDMGSSIGVLFAVHIADGVLPFPLIAASWVVLVLLVLWAWRDLNEYTIPKVGLFTAALFVASQIHIRIGPGSVHLLLTGIAGIVLGRLAIVSVLVAVVFQALLFAHGGFSTIGVNALQLGWSAVIVGLAWRAFAKPTAWWGAFAGGFACALSVAWYAAFVWFGIPDSRNFVLLAIGWHVPIVVIEAIGTGIVVAYLAKVKPDWVGVPNTTPV